MLAVSAMAVQNALVQVSLHGVPATAVITTNIARFTTDVGTILLGLGVMKWPHLANVQIDFGRRSLASSLAAA
jgi:uncharacterized membrane protein YoaK (UPF0700 family)